jgi:hypothetical protein
LVEDDNNDDGDIGNQYEDMNEECNKKIGLHNEANVGLFLSSFNYWVHLNSPLMYKTEQCPTDVLKICK